ncbi:response regulator transcription factor [Sphingobacterium sp. DN00404]|uniref:Response regulator transcription factor n=1 Tax=Sphingobacterium micropteri TaxID=2763501 RepID=A0ABR7YN42_9SPHI|nr:response regulator transcription factor [Sphingobacterium micropteri]MBD1432646.1 response regulator transcription factor [Sphingobacterium micropteri]
MEKTKILLAEDHLVVRNGIKLLLDAQANFEVVADVGSGREILDLIAAGVEGDILITDLTMDNVDGLQLIKELNQRGIKMYVIVLSMLDEEHYVAQSFQYGARAYLVKNVTADEMLFCINHVAKGGRYLCEELTMKLVDKLINKEEAQSYKMDPAELSLSSREMEVLELLGEGLTNLEISKKLFLSKRTVEGHRQSLIDKTKSKNTPALIKFAIQNGLLK